LATVTRIMMSFGEALAYSAITSKYLPPSNTPESHSSNSGSIFDRLRFSPTRWSYGNAAWGYLYRAFM